MRVYVPFTPSGLAAAHAAREIGPTPLVAYAVTPALREWCGSTDLEELEYEALGRAAQASLRLLAGHTADGADLADWRRVVVAVDVAERDVAGATGEAEDAADERLGQVWLTRPVPFSKVDAAHVDDAEAAEEVRVACAAWGATVDEAWDALPVVEAVAEHELLWFARQEIEQVL